MHMFDSKDVNNLSSVMQTSVTALLFELKISLTVFYFSWPLSI